MEANENENPKKKGMPAILESAKHGLGAVIEKGREAVKKGMGTIASALTPHEPAIISDENNSYIAEELAKKLSTYYNGTAPEIRGVELKAGSTPGTFNVTAKLGNLNSTTRGAQEADLKALVEIPNPLNYVVPASSISGMITFNPIPAGNMDWKPKIHKIDLEITKTIHAGGDFDKYIEETIRTNYPDGKLIGQTGPLVFENETDYCGLFISDTAKDSKSSEKNIIRSIKFPVRKVPVERTIDECLSVKDYEYRLLPPEELFTIGFPESRQIRKELEKEKTILRRLMYDNMKPGLLRVIRKPFFSIKTPPRKTEPGVIGPGTEFSFNIEFDCVTGIGPFAKPHSAAVEFFYAAGSDTGKEDEKAKTLRYLRRGDFVVKA